ncbi:thiamine diphosphokinase [Pseudooceanicola marinus]|uniref:thiamine diphosphokinase n=1 Tax=Pseudooceanicola marinus TaxID=396013 RepID=UPI001CD67D36|nr:thiamine diphosphokinase [Pseudooceanicola marinus]MCA1336750.1 thiamine diphosphokinase [Pseudooceanicola marinus]
MGLDAVVTSPRAVALVGGGRVPEAVLDRILALTGPVVGADGGAAALLARGVSPDAVVGDMDSLSAPVRAQVPGARVHHIPEQASTDFEKCLTRIAAPLVLGTGFLGPRADHMLAALSVLTTHPDRRCLLASDSDVAFLAPPELRLSRPAGERLSLFPMGAVTGQSVGLEWPIEGLSFAPDGQIGTSNRVTGPVRLRFDRPGMIVILPVAALEDAAAALDGSPAQWPARAG